MRYFILITFLIFLSGCTLYHSVKNSCTIYLNITSDVVPTITTSTGIGVYDEQTQQFVLRVKNSKTVDISISHEDYDTILITIPSDELIKGNVVRNVVFDKLKSAIVDLFVKSDALYEDIIISGYDDYIQNGYKFTFHLPSRSETLNLEIAAAGNYRTEKITITPDHLVVGYYQEDIYLLNNNQVLLSLDIGVYSFSYYIVVKSIITGIEYESIRSKNYMHFVINKGDEIIVRTFQENQYIEMLTDLETKLEKYIDFSYISPSISPVPFKRYIVNYNIAMSTDYYMEYEGKRHRLALHHYSSQHAAIFLPPSSNIYYIQFSKDEYKFYVHKGFDQNQSSICLNLDCFIEDINHRYKIRFNNYLTNEYIESISIKNELIFSDENGYFIFDKIPIKIDGFKFSPINPIIDEEFVNGEWVIDKMLIPDFEGYIVDFIDFEGNPIKLDKITNAQINHLGDNRVFIEDNGFDNNLLINIKEFRFDFGNRYLTNNIFLFIQMFDFIDIDGKTYLQIKRPVKVNTNLYELCIYINPRSSNDLNFTVYKEGIRKLPDVKFSTNFSGYNFEIGDSITIQYIYNNNLEYFHITLTEEILLDGILYIDPSMNLPMKPHEFFITFSEDFEFVDASFQNLFAKFDVSEDKRSVKVRYMGALSYMSLTYRDIKNDRNIMEFFNISNQETIHIEN